MVAIKLSHFIITPHMAAASRTKTPRLKDLDEMQKLIKNNIKQDRDPVVHPTLWRHRDMSCVVDQYQEFLAAISDQGKLFAKTELTYALKKQFAGDPKVIKEFADVLVAALAHCKAKSRQIRTGSKTFGPVLRIASLWQKHSSSSTLGATEEAANSDSEVEEVSTNKNKELGEQLAAQKCLLDAQKIFGGGSSMKTLKRHVSVCSVASSEGEICGEAADSSEPSATEAAKASKLQRAAAPKASEQTTDRRVLFFTISKKQYP